MTEAEGHIHIILGQDWLLGQTMDVSVLCTQMYFVFLCFPLFNAMLFKIVSQFNKNE